MQALVSGSVNVCVRPFLGATFVRPPKPSDSRLRFGNRLSTRQVIPVVAVHLVQDDWVESADRRSDIAWSAEIVSGRTRAEGIGARVGIVLALAAICPPTADVAPASLLLAQPLGQLGELAFARRAFLPESFTFFTAGRDR